uniref:Uncharacterized protein n=1 Tax=Cacopsylla melanoneura TaxID=428564 RepID=A0A8D9BT94_9HEMI
MGINNAMFLTGIVQHITNIGINCCIVFIGILEHVCSYISNFCCTVIRSKIVGSCVVDSMTSNELCLNCHSDHSVSNKNKANNEHGLHDCHIVSPGKQNTEKIEHIEKYIHKSYKSLNDFTTLKCKQRSLKRKQMQSTQTALQNK